MTLTSSTVRLSYNGDGSTTSFSVTYVFWDADDLKVTLRDANGAETVWTRGTEYTVTGGDGSTGTVEATTAPASGETLVILSNVPDTQDTSFPLGGAFPSTSAERELDKTVRRIQQQAETLGRAPKLAETSPDSDLTFPDMTGNAGKFIRVNSGASDLEAASPAASDISFSNTASGLTATEVQAALDEIDGNVDSHTHTLADISDSGALAAGDNASDVSYSNSSSGLTATDAQAAIDEVKSDLDAVEASGVSDGDKGDITVTSSGTTWTIDAGVVTAGKLAADAVETAKIKNLNVTTAKIADLAVSTAKIAAGGVTTAKVADDAVTYAKMQDVSATSRFLGRITAGAGDPEELTGTQATTLLDAFTSSLKGLAPASGGGTSNFLRADGTWAAPRTLTAEVDLTNDGLNDLTTVELATGLPSGLNAIDIVFNGMSLSGTDDVFVQIGDSGGYETSGYTSTGGKVGTSASSTSGSSGFVIRLSDAAHALYGTMRLRRTSGNKWVADYAGRTATTTMALGGGEKELSATLDRVRVISEVSDTFDNGAAAVQHQ